MQNDVSIETFNETTENLFFVFFQQDLTKDESGNFISIYPIAWHVIAIPGLPGRKRRSPRFLEKNPFNYPGQNQIGVITHQIKYPAGIQYSTWKNAAPNSKWISLHDGYFWKLQDCPDTNSGGIISCLNKAQSMADVAILKDRKPLIVYRRLPEDEEAKLLLTPKIYVMWSSDPVEPGEILTSYQEQACEIHLTNVKKVVVSLKVVNEMTRKKEWFVKTC